MEKGEQYFQTEQLMSYAEFINMALYDESFGYYMKNVPIGKKGDFYTSPTLSSVFADTIFSFFHHVVKKDGLPPVFCEIGSSKGDFARSFLQAVRKHSFDSLKYLSVEKSPLGGKEQQDLLRDAHFQFFSSIDDIPPFSGVVFSNEFFDALPVHVLTRKSGKLFEVKLTSSKGTFKEVLVPLQNREIFEYLESFPEFTIQEGQRVEIPLEMFREYGKITKKLRNGYIVTVDYGYTFEEMQEPALKEGSLRGYQNHRMKKSVLDRPGTMDITYHIPFDALRKKGEESGFSTVQFVMQHEFLLQWGILQGLESYHGKDPFHPILRRNRAIRMLSSPNGISGYFRVLVQKK